MSFEVSSMALFALAGLTIVTAALLYGWQGWLALKMREAEMGHGEFAPSPARDVGDAPAAARIELADLKERVRRLEAIASGVDL
ncbi:hypothetical protein [Croceicoccus marinus]|uniref:Uncharacterized protein n=1 Tax=Croceicoccus marinus TaxID=450378 RepID=A0A1Z1FBU4_9SPHN|nr:hypothetical protein [Croceicoccus marinus]ARU16230.1 hypothetical protein A9D14_08490 [Croceicoccus marinus]